MKRKIPVLYRIVAAWLCLTPMAGIADQEPSYYDYAVVERVTPIREARQIPVPDESCSETPYLELAMEEYGRFAGDVRLRIPGITLSEVIRRDIRLRQRMETEEMRPCRSKKVFEREEVLVGYRVEYRYGGERFVRRMQHHPGTRVRVRVALSIQR